MRGARGGGAGLAGPRHRLAGLVALGLLTPTLAGATAFDYLPVGDPLEAELRALDLFHPRALGERLRLPHLGTRPLQLLELQGPGAPPAPPSPAVAFSLARLERALGRDAGPGFEAHPAYRSTPRLLALADAEGQRFEVSTALEGVGEADRHEVRSVSGSGLHGRLAAQFDRWLVYSHLVVGRFDRARTFADPIVARSDVITHTEESYLAYTGAAGRWGAQLGRSRWHWGPGEEASLLLSKTSAALTGLALHARLEPLRTDVAALSATLDAAAGEQLAAHRLEWQPHESLRIGITEAARYHASGWQPLYAAGVIPYVLVQRIAVQDEPDSATALRNNVEVGFDFSWRVAEGTRLYAECVIDDLHARDAHYPDKLGYQLGWEGGGMFGGTRLTWGGEYTRLSRFVYTSYFGREYASQGRPLGFPTGPDAERVRVRGVWDFSPDWQLAARVTHTRLGGGGLDEAFVPGSPRVDSWRFLGPIERSREAELALRWWPASGVDLALSGGYRWIENAGHEPGVHDDGARAALAVRIVR